MAREKGRDSKETEGAISSYNKRVAPEDLERYRDAGVEEIVIVTAPARDESQIAPWVVGLAAK